MTCFERREREEDEDKNETAREFYDDESAEMVYSNNVEIFNLNHYDKDSYKI